MGVEGSTGTSGKEGEGICRPTASVGVSKFSARLPHSPDALNGSLHICPAHPTLASQSVSLHMAKFISAVPSSTLWPWDPVGPLIGSSPAPGGFPANACSLKAFPISGGPRIGGNTSLLVTVAVFSLSWAIE